MSKKLPKLGAAFDRQSWEYIQDNDEEIAAALAAEVADGATPEVIRRFILANVGGDRTGIAARCESAARHLERMKK